MAPFSKPAFAVVLSSSLLLQLFMIFDHETFSEAAAISPRRSLDFISGQGQLEVPDLPSVFCSMGVWCSRRSLDFNSVQACRCCQSSSRYQYSVVIDAGSSGSRVHVYRWPQSTGGRVKSTPGAVQALQPTLKIHVGLATVADNLTIVRHHVERLLTNASRIVPPDLQQYTPVYFMATAGKQCKSTLLTVRIK